MPSPPNLYLESKMHIELNPDTCNRCGTCANICPCDCLRLPEDGGAAELRYPDDCWYCGSCELDCPTGAIVVNLPYLIP